MLRMALDVNCSVETKSATRCSMVTWQRSLQLLQLMGSDLYDWLVTASDTQRYLQANSFSGNPFMEHGGRTFYLHAWSSLSRWADANLCGPVASLNRVNICSWDQDSHGRSWLRANWPRRRQNRLLKAYFAPPLGVRVPSDDSLSCWCLTPGSDNKKDEVSFKPPSLCDEIRLNESFVAIITNVTEKQTWNESNVCKISKNIFVWKFRCQNLLILYWQLI